MNVDQACGEEMALPAAALEGAFGARAYAVTRYDDVCAINGDPQIFSNAGGLLMPS